MARQICLQVDIGTLADSQHHLVAMQGKDFSQDWSEGVSRIKEQENASDRGPAFSLNLSFIVHVVHTVQYIDAPGHPSAYSS